MLVDEKHRKKFDDTRSVLKKYDDEIRAAKLYIKSKRNDFIERDFSTALRNWVNDNKSSRKIIKSKKKSSKPIATQATTSKSIVTESEESEKSEAVESDQNELVINESESEHSVNDTN